MLNELGLGFTNSHGAPRVLLGVASHLLGHDVTGLVVFDKAGKVISSLTPLPPSCEPTVAPLTGSVEQRPASSLVFFDNNGKVFWSVP